jgi:hypothetical protein
MKTYGQYCPVARAADILGERWALLILRDILVWNEAHGLTVTRVNALDETARDEYRKAFVAFHEKYRTKHGITMPRDYIIAHGVRR